MNNNIKRETDIYELLLEDTLYEIILDGEYYENYIIYTDYRNIKYRIFIHENLLGHNIKFYVDTTSTTNKLIVLSFAEDIPLCVLLEDNDHNENNMHNYIQTTEAKATTIAGDEDDTNDYDSFEYETITLIYDSSNNVYRDNLRTYKIYNKDSNRIKQIIRHFKVIKLNFGEPLPQNAKYCLYYKDTNKLYNWFTNNDDAINELNKYIAKYGDNLRYVIENTYIKELSQDPNLYVNNLYNDDGFSANNHYNNQILSFTKYYTVNEFKDKLYNDKIIATYSYANQITEDFVDGNSELNNIDYDLQNSNYFYIRFAPHPNIKDIQAKRVFQIRHIYTNYDDEEYLNILVQRSQMPIYNDNLFYSENKCNIVDNRLNLNMIN